MKIEIDFRDLKKFCDRVMIRRYKDMSEKFLGKINGNPILYKVYIKDFGDFESGLTCINSGDVEGEYFMTKGHRHKKPFNEMYMLIKGKGKLLVQGKETRVVELRKNKIYNIPGTSGHRLINIGKTKLQVLTIYSKGAGHDYKFRFKFRRGKIKHKFDKRFFRK
ncbi:MAG: glucose-6-phosphate isomerase family protein [Candidatus Pacearchaeota archaeon]|jgi:glucose-6-phosphate isomerase